DTTIATLMARLGKNIVAPAAMGPALGAVIEDAGRPDPEYRIDAAGLIQGLDRAARTLPAPDPLPIVGMAGGGDNTVVDDLTVLPSAADVADDPTDLIPPAP